MPRLTRLLALAGVLTVAAAGTAACGSDDDGTATAAGGGDAGAKQVEGGGGTLRIALIGNTGVMAAAKNDGSLAKDLEKVGAKVQFTGKFPAFAPAAEAINAGAVDAASASISAGIGALAQHPSFSIYAAQEANNAGEGILVKDPAIKTVKDLAGKKVAVNPNGTGEYLLLKALDQAGVPRDEVERVYLPLPDGASAFTSGKVDAWAAFGEFVATAKADGARLLASGADIGSENDTIWVISKQFLEEHPATVKVLFENVRRHSVEAHEDPQAAVEKENVGAVKLSDAAVQVLADSYRTLEPIDAITPEFRRRFANVAQFFADQGVLKQPLDIDQFVTDVNGL